MLVILTLTYFQYAVPTQKQNNTCVKACDNRHAKPKKQHKHTHNHYKKN